MNELAMQEHNVLMAVGDNLFFNVQLFDHAQRVAKMLGSSTMVPEHFRGPQNIGNVLIAMNYAQRVRADVFMVMQSLYVVHGHPGLEGKLVIALVNQCGRFDPLQFEIDDDGCLAFAKEIKSGKVLKGPKVTWDMVKAEGWLGKNGSKWQTMPDVMFRYRSAAFFARTYCPEVLLGMQTKEELDDIITLRPTTNGSHYAAPAEPPPEKDFDYDAFRTGLITNGFFAADIDAFENKLAAHYKKSVEEIRQQIGNDVDGFIQALGTWTEKNGTPHEPTQEEPPSADFIRDEFINLRTAGYSTWVHKNKGRIVTFPDAIQAEIRDKWAKMYQGIAFPLDNEDTLPAMVQAHAAELAKTNGNGPYLNCPINQMRKSVKVCEICNTRDKCQTFQEWQFENATA